MMPISPATPAPLPSWHYFAALSGMVFLGILIPAGWIKVCASGTLQVEPGGSTRTSSLPAASVHPAGPVPAPAPESESRVTAAWRSAGRASYDRGTE